MDVVKKIDDLKIIEKILTEEILSYDTQQAINWINYASIADGESFEVFPYLPDIAILNGEY